MRGCLSLQFRPGIPIGGTVSAGLDAIMSRIKTPRLKSAAKYLWKEWLRPLAVTAAFLLPVKSSLADWNWVPTGSMKPTILEGDLVCVNKLAYDLKVPFTLKRAATWAAPAAGEVVVLFSPEDGTRLVKRIVAGPGDTLEMRGNALAINGTPLAYELRSADPFRDEVYEDPRPVLAKESLGGGDHWVMAFPSRAMPRSFAKVVVPAGHYFVMGDSRDNSKDSRAFGFVPREKIVGRVYGTLASFDKNRWCRPRFGRFFSGLDG